VSEDTVAVVTRWAASLDAGKPDTEMCDPEVEFENWTDFPSRGPYRGHDGVRSWWEDVSDVFEEMHWLTLSVEPIDDDRCLTIQRLTGRFRHTGIETDFTWGAIIGVRDGKIASGIGFPTERRARRAAGLG
jgi:ketosteroid isomerase-like protein